MPDSGGEDPRLAADMARAYVDGSQTSTGDREISAGWGLDSCQRHGQALAQRRPRRHTYDFAFGLGWDGVIDDARTARYKR